MQITINLSTKRPEISIDTEKAINLSQTIRRNPAEMPNAYFISAPKFSPVVTESFIGDTAQNGACNCEYITFNAHGNGTHTECVGHISKAKHYMNEVSMPLFLEGFLVNAAPVSLANGDQLISLISYDWSSLPPCNAVIINSKTTQHNEVFSGKNPCYIDEKVTRLLAEKGILHLLTDLPSVDREEDGGALAAHKAFFQYPQTVDLSRTITELLHIPAHLNSGPFVIAIAYAAMETDAVLSEVYVYPILTP